MAGPAALDEVVRVAASAVQPGDSKAAWDTAPVGTPAQNILGSS